ncbi:MAG TPA: hypothetical protein VG253_00560 [Streptosporangiaceae bacterium]|jgi:hypothetical protein|nr:hypothetical protein [Streptosporangiaceae bacterium]
MASTEQPGEVSRVNVSGQGMQLGTGNVQNNTWVQKAPLDPAVLSGRNPHTAVALLRQLSHDELVDFFIRASPGDVSEILAVFAEVDLTRIVATLGDISRRKATELIGAIDEDERPAVLDDLLEATEAIARKAAVLGWADAEPLEIFMEGYARKYDNGHVFWSVGDGIVRTRGAIDRYWAEGSADLGFPVQDPETAPSSPYGTTGVRQRFQPSTVYSSKRGVFLITDAMCYENEGGSGGWLGFPVSGRERNGQFGDRQMFEGGAIYSYIVEGPEGLRSFAVRPDVPVALPDSSRFRPASKVAKVVSSSGKLGIVQSFEVELESGTCTTAVYWDEAKQPVMVAPQVWDYYSKLGAEKSRLGFPTRRSMASGNGIQQFEGGRIYWLSGSNPVAAYHAVLDVVALDKGISGQIGFPVTEEQPVGTGESDSTQFFQGGVVTCRGGKYEVWVRPEQKAVEPDKTASSNDSPALPLAGYDEMSVASIRALLRDLSAEQLAMLIEYERNNARRRDVIAMFERRILALGGRDPKR